jgi:hypothetical protein
MSMDKFHTRKRASAGRKIYLADPGTGSLTKDWLVIRSRWCDEFQEAKADAVQDAFAEAKEPNDEEKKAISETRKLSLVASLVGSWSFDEECTTENIINFLREAPQLVDQIDKKAAQDKFFFGKASKNS